MNTFVQGVHALTSNTDLQMLFVVMSNEPQSFLDVDCYRRGICIILQNSESWNKNIQEEGAGKENPNATGHNQSRIAEIPH